MNSKPVFGAFTFFARRHPGELCGSNGLPLTPNSITIFGRSQILKTLEHPQLCGHLDVIRGKHERIIVVSEFYDRSLKDLSQPVALDDIKKLARDILVALEYMHERGIVHRSLNPDNILLDNKNNIKLYNYGLYHMCNFGQCVSFPIGHPKYMAPEVYMGKEKNTSGPKVDIWSLGLILAELCLNKCFWSDLKLSQVMRRVVSLLNCSVPVFEHLANTHNCIETYKALPNDVKEFIGLCLMIDLIDRPVTSALLRHPFLDGLEDTIEINNNDIGYHIGFLQRVSIENARLVKQMQKCCLTSNHAPEGKLPTYEQYRDKAILELYNRSLKELYHLWQLAGGDVLSELKKQGMIKSKPPILTLSSLVLLEGTAFGEQRDAASMLDLRVIPLSMEALHHRLSHLPLEAYYPLIETVSPIIGKDGILDDLPSLPLVIREKDTEYQFHRIILFQRLLQGYPYKAEAILKEAERDIPPFCRGSVWAALLGVIGDVQGVYEAIDKETPTHTDRQIEVDIPRCHQYDELLSSSEGHNKLKRVLKAWVISHPQYVYWQGLDSLCAPFLYLNFNNEALAYACLSAFIPKYLHNLFLKDNSAVIKEYLSKFRQLIAYHDPELANHMDHISFVPDLFSIPWFLTVFSHVFPLHRIFHLWDKLLLGDSSFPLYVGLAVLTQLRETLLTSGFNECILLFSDLPEVDMERCVKDSMSLYEATPRSICYRQHALLTTVPNSSSSSSLDISSPPSLSDLEREFCPRISAADLLYLLDVNMFSEEQVALVVDARSVDDWVMGTVRHSLNLPFNAVSLSELQLPATKEGRVLEENSGKIIVVVGSGGENLAEFCKWLVQCGLPKVCSLHGGIQALKTTTGVLVSPTH